MSERKTLHGWKQISSYLGQAVRTIQRYEATLKLPIRRPAGKDHTAVFAFSDELDEWLERAKIKSRPYVRPVLIVIDPPDAHHISNRKLALEMEKFNVLTAFTPGEVVATAQRIDVDGFVLACDPSVPDSAQLCESLKQRYPAKPIFAVGGKDWKEADYVVDGDDPGPLVEIVLKHFGKPKVA
jgi:PleD family two-component response regulator